MSKKESGLAQRWGNVLTLDKGGVLSVNVEAIEEPQRIFVAHAVRIDRTTPKSTSFQLTFGQIIAPGRLAAVVVIQLEEEMLRAFLKSCHSEFRGTVERLARGEDQVPVLTDHMMIDISLDRVWTGKASICRASVSLNGAQLEWFEVSPRALVKFLREQGPSVVQGVVTIFLSPDCFRSLLRQADERIGPDGQLGQAAPTL